MLSLMVPITLLFGCQNVRTEQSPVLRGLADNVVSPAPKKLVVLTFDDGNISDLATAAPILKTHGFGATFYITSGWVGKPGRLNWE